MQRRPMAGRWKQKGHATLVGRSEIQQRLPSSGSSDDLFPGGVAGQEILLVGLCPNASADVKQALTLDPGVRHVAVSTGVLPCRARRLERIRVFSSAPIERDGAE